MQRVDCELRSQLNNLSTKDIATTALVNNSYAVLVDTIDEGKFDAVVIFSSASFQH